MNRVDTEAIATAAPKSRVNSLSLVLPLRIQIDSTRLDVAIALIITGRSKDCTLTLRTV